MAQASSGGKRVRPALVLAAYAGFGGQDLALAMPVAVSFELLHTAFTIHDDVIDRDLTRRGLPNIAGTFQRRARELGASEDQSSVWATTAAILAGDLALSEAHRAIATLPVDVGARTQLLDLIDRSVFVSAAGELADVTNTVGQAATIEQVLSTLELKTAVYSFEAPLQAGAIVAGASPEALDALGQFGRLIGIAFQLTDDLLGVFGDAAVTGKSTASDLREGKQTTLIAFARTTAAWPEIDPLLGSPALTDAQADLVREHLRDCGALHATEDLIRDHVSRAVGALDTPALPEAVRTILTDLVALATERRR
nr:polyprenyl synthetase family protein [Leifsonia psychrotolerans]